MSDVIIPLGNRFLILSDEQFQQALARGQELLSHVKHAQGSSPETTLDASGMARMTQIPASWFREQARKGAIPHFRAGKYVRFQLSEVLRALQIDVYTDRQSVAPRERGSR